MQTQTDEQQYILETRAASTCPAAQQSEATLFMQDGMNEPLSMDYSAK